MELSTASLRRSPTWVKRRCIKCGKQDSLPLYGFNFISALHCIHALSITKRIKFKKSPRQQTQHSRLCTIDMFCAICKFMQFWNCTAQIRNFEIANQFERGIWFRNCAVKFRYRRRRDHKYWWWVQEIQTSIISDSVLKRPVFWSVLQSKMISKDKGQKIMRLLKSDPIAVNYSSQLKFWVKKRGFQLTTLLVP